MSLKLTYQLEPLTLWVSNFPSAVELVEKTIKLFLSFQEKQENALTHYSRKYGHNIEKLRRQAAQINSKFDDEDIKAFCKPFNDRAGAFFQHLRYGSQQTIEGYSTQIGSIMPTAEKIFFTCIMELDEDDRRMINTTSLLNLLILDSEMDQTTNRELLLKAIKANNPYFKEYEKYCLKTEEKRLELIKNFENQKK